MDTDEVIPSKVQRQGSFQVSQLLRESVRQARKTAKLHTDREVLAFDERCRNIPKPRIATDWDRPRIHDITRAVPLAVRFVAAENLDQHRVINIRPEVVLDCRQVRRETVACKLNSMR